MQQEVTRIDVPGGTLAVELVTALAGEVLS
jgi:hypothetical protein